MALEDEGGAAESESPGSIEEEVVPLMRKIDGHHAKPDAKSYKKSKWVLGTVAATAAALGLGVLAKPGEKSVSDEKPKEKIEERQENDKKETEPIASAPNQPSPKPRAKEPIIIPDDEPTSPAAPAEKPAQKPAVSPFVEESPKPEEIKSEPEKASGAKYEEYKQETVDLQKISDILSDAGFIVQADSKGFIVYDWKEKEIRFLEPKQYDSVLNVQKNINARVENFTQKSGGRFGAGKAEKDFKNDVLPRQIRGIVRKSTVLSFEDLPEGEIKELIKKNMAADERRAERKRQRGIEDVEKDYLGQTIIGSPTSETGAESRRLTEEEIKQGGEAIASEREARMKELEEIYKKNAEAGARMRKEWHQEENSARIVAETKKQAEAEISKKKSEAVVYARNTRNIITTALNCAGDWDTMEGKFIRVVLNDGDAYKLYADETGSFKYWVDMAKNPEDMKNKIKEMVK